jgi:O-6-methylguanine DNA methyltransferase
MPEGQLLRDLRALGSARAPAGLLEAVLNELQLGDRYAVLGTPLGPVWVAWNQHGVSAVMRSESAEAFEATFQQRYGRPVRPAPDLPNEARTRFDLRGLSEFERAVLLKALEIPRGEFRTYGWIAAQIGHPAAVRAVGTVLRKNPVPVLIPCHRVVRSDGQIGQYALGGSAAKRQILAAEGVVFDHLGRPRRAAAS